jgi:NDP-hexose-3-ketoreductase
VDRERDVVLAGDVLLATLNGVGAHLRFGMQHSYRTSIEFSGSAGRIVLDRAFTPPDTHRPVIRIERQDHREESLLPEDHQFVNAVRAFADAVVRGEPNAWTEYSLRQSRLVDLVAEKAVSVYIPL